MRLVVTLIAALVFGAPVALALLQGERVPAAALGPHKPDLENGRVMFHAGGCASCHATPGQEDRTRLGGGLRLDTTFGTFVMPNISPHERDGIGAWSERDFLSALLKGTSPEGAHYYPAFPYPSYQRMRGEDARDLFAYIKTLPPVEGRTPAHELRFPYSFRPGLTLWKLFYLDGEPFRADPARSASRNRGAYLVEGPGHCAECHSPRNWIGAVRQEQRFAGGPDPDGKGFAPNITQHERGIRNWSEADIETLLATGDLPGGDSIGGSMRSVVRDISQLPAADRKAMAEYLKSLPAIEGPSRPQNP